MGVYLTGISACGFYSAGLALRVRALHHSEQPPLGTSLALAVPAALTHALSTWFSINTVAGMQLGLFNIASLVFLVIVLITHLVDLRNPAGNLLLVLYPLAILSLLFMLFVHTGNPSRTKLGWGVGSHIAFSVLSYSLLTIAAVQAAGLGMLNRALKQRQTHGLIDLMPPLQTMERLLFQLIWAGEILLTLAILSGVVYLEDMFAQHVAHKTILSIIAWIIFAVLLWGRHRRGWRGSMAIRWTLSGFLALILAYFGSAIVLELLLHRY